MYRRSSTKGLHRRKSTSSVHSKHESMDPELARQQAYRAATLAFARAQERKSADVGHSGGGLSRNNTSKSKQLDRHPPQPPSTQQANTMEANTTDNAERPVIRRQHSVRFVGPTGISRSQSLGTRAAQNPVQRKLSNATLRPVAMTTDAPVPAAYRPPSRSSSIGKASMRGGTAEQYVTGDAFDEYYTREDDVASTPSSYRRIRRSKSMFSPLKAVPDVFYTNGTPDRRDSSHPRAGNSQTSSTQPKHSALRAPRSMSFLRGRRDHTQSERNDNAVQLARDRFFRDAEQQRLREQPSFLFRSKSQAQEKPFRKSVRTSSANSYGGPVASANQSIAARDSGLKDVARKASRNLKNKFKRVFGRSSKDDEPVTVPNQQVDARETHVRQYNGDHPSDEQEFFSNIPHPDEGSLSRVASRQPTIHPANSSQQLRSNAGSIKSIKSVESDDKSRVTSWSTSGANTIPSQPAKSLLSKEQLHRLSIINEVGSHVPSLSFSRTRKNQPSAYPSVVHRPSKRTGDDQAPGPGYVDSARVYSALMKRIDENSPTSKLKAAQKPNFESFSMSVRCGDPKADRTPVTIRQVPPSSRNTSNSESVDIRPGDQSQLYDAYNHTGPYTQQWVTAENLQVHRHVDDVFSPKDTFNNKENVPISQPQSKNIPNTTPAGLSHRRGSKASFHTVPDAGRTPQEIAKQNEPVIQHPKGIRESRSAFFGGGGSYTIPRTASPFRRAMTESDYNPVALSGNVPLSHHFAAPMLNPLYLAPESSTSAETVINVAQGPDDAYSESIYSRTTSGQTPVPAKRSISLVLQHDVPDMQFFGGAGPGDVVILDRTTYRPTMPSGAGHRATSSAGSSEWKRWMSSEVAKLERVKENTNTSYVNYALPTMPKSFHRGHVREAAQINDDDDDEMDFASVAPKKLVAVKQPLGVVQQQSSNIPPAAPILKPILKKRSTISLVEPVPAILPTNTILSAPPPPPPPPPPPLPPISQRSPIRHMQSKSSLRSVSTVNTVRTGGTASYSAPKEAIQLSSMSGRNLLHKRNPSQSTLRSTRSSIKSFETPAKLVKRHGRPAGTATAQSSPGSGLVGAVERQFGSTSTNSRYKTPGPGTARSTGASGGSGDGKVEEDIYGVEGTGLMGPNGDGKTWSVSQSGNERFSTSEGEAQAKGSKLMVDMFLSSRRRRMISESEQGRVFL
ncbi:hypothetical protein MBM_07520 [Drepanopeziza brunnea f. sp. 'multigermtubi' MB_m1]|uniref:Uncharacterized protein n=1 Tax=Marssonina brunnea f. sp. multigermtubi (strain MB_m1) TaxID=1072389 RepID=K1WAI8_MARBU|nr:uncharacterized protein MBM_07520 [Drepanopeziza brunnea f. sp. 'multigermtubi' MB_m1]EKD14290.1 hypothetical protein MBM_07520 [Drepanopeziza brunnea f. sp. 'multigermtubi' MB_m1]